MLKMTEGIEITQENVFRCLHDESMRQQVFTHQHIVGLHVESSSYHECLFSQCVFYATHFIATSFTNTTFRNCTFEFSHFLETNFINCKFINCQWKASSSRQGKVENCLTDESSLNIFTNNPHELINNRAELEESLVEFLAA